MRKAPCTCIIVGGYLNTVSKIPPAIGPEMLMNLFNTLQYGLKSMQLA